MDALVNKDLEFAMGGGAANFMKKSLGKNCKHPGIRYNQQAK